MVFAHISRGCKRTFKGHTKGHIALHFSDQRVAFVGDALFAMGCGRMFEGTYDQMFEVCARMCARPCMGVAQPSSATLPSCTTPVPSPRLPRPLPLPRESSESRRASGLAR